MTTPTTAGHRSVRPSDPAPAPWTAAELRALCRELGADDAGFVEVDRPQLASERDAVSAALPGARTLVAFVVRTNPDALRSPPRSVANLEFHDGVGRVEDVGRRIVAALRTRGARAITPAAGFPMDMEHFPGRVWVVSHKPVAVEAGLGRMGIHRNLIHPRFGNFVLLGTVITDAAVDDYDRPIDFDPCLECKLCVAACPVGAIGADGSFQFSACYTHNYREFMSGFTDWAETVAGAADARALRRSLRDDEQASMWQSLSFGPNYKAAYCMAVCPAGEDVIGPFVADRKAYVGTVVRPLQQRRESLYVVPGSDAEAYAARRFPHKELRRVHSALRPTSIAGFLRALPLVFQRGRAAGLDAVFQFDFTGDEPRQATVTIRGGRLEVRDGLHGEADVAVRADAATWLGYLRRDRGIAWALLRRRVRVRGPLRLLRAFERCFPS